MGGSEKTIRPFTRELRKQGFEFEFRDRGGGTTVTQFRKRQGDRMLHVQFWASGKHRVSHGTVTKLPNGQEGMRETTTPTDFTTVDQMLKAIELEWTRPSGPGVVMPG